LLLSDVVVCQCQFYGTSATHMKLEPELLQLPIKSWQKDKKT